MAELVAIVVIALLLYLGWKACDKDTQDKHPSWRQIHGPDKHS